MNNNEQPADSAAENDDENAFSENDFIVVGIGASAGGVQALKDFFTNVPEASGIAYVVILHLSPDHDSKLAEVLQSVARIPVRQVKSETLVAPDHVYVVPPNQHLLMTGRHLSVTLNTQVQDRRAPVDIFFRTLAESHRSRAVCVVLSGTGANGSMGLKRIKECGGAAFVQNPREAEFNEMPRNAISTELVDEVLAAAEIPRRILEYKERLGKVHIEVKAERRPDDQQQALIEVLTQLRVRTGHDFTNYKQPTLLRRIERRITVRRMADLPAYAALLAQNPDETNALLKDLLISVTNFFRDSKAFQIIEQEVLPIIIRNKNAEQQVRIWVPGCATGEEAYSLAILCAELTFNVIDAPKIQIFATDIDEPAIAQAREGLYTINDAADVSPERLRRFFNKEGEEYRIRREVREMILFANHNVIKDPPFSHLDLISCRNILIYLNRTAQQRVMDTFHFALNPGAFLFLGSSESADAATELYSTYNRDAHIFQKKQGSGARAYPVPESVPHLRFDEAEKTLARQQRATTERITHSELHQRLLEEYAPPSIVVDEHYEIVHLSDRAGRYLHVAGGEPSQNLLKLIRPELRLDLRSALYQATQRRAAVEARGLKLSIDEAVETINILIRPVLHTGDVTRGFLLVLFERADNVDGQTDVVISSDEPVAKHLEEELIRLKSQLRVSNEQHEFNAEELKASNEELQAMNEELRSAAEELETSKEELQSINEELRTVNQELKVKVEETTLASNNLQNVINSVDIGTIFLDRGLRVAFFTPAARTLFNLIPSDLGRPLSDLTGHLVYDHLTSDAESVLEKLHPVEREVRTNDGRVFMMRVLPYRTAEDRINGVVITFIDVTSLKRTQDALKASEERLRLVLEGAKDYAIFTIDTDRRITSWNKGAEAVMGYSEKEIMGQLGDIIFVPEDRAREHPVMEVSKARQFGVAENERWHLRKDGSRFYGSGTVRPLEDSTGKITGFVKVMRDLTEQKRAADALVQSEERFRAMVSQTNAGLLHTDLNGIITLVNSKLCDILGYSERELLGKSIWELTFADDRETNRQIFDSLRTKMIPSEAEKRLLHKDGFPIWVSESLSAIRNERGEAESAVAVILDISSRKELEEQKDEFIGIASHELKTPVTSIKAYTELLQERLEKTGHEENVMLINKLGSQVDRLVELIRNLLGTTRIAEGKMVLNLETLDLRELVKEQIEEFKRFSNKHKFVLKSSDVRPVDADRERITQVLTNLLSNAVKYSPDGGKVGVTIEEEDNEVKVTIADKGVGIADDAKDRIFDRFFRASTATNETQPGMGLGLYITAGIVHRHGGTISFESKIGKGSKFWFILPI